MRRDSLFIAAMCGALSVLRCSSINPLAGGYDVPDFKVVGAIATMDGKGAPDTRVQMIPAEYDPFKDPPLPDSLTDTTDANGCFYFSDLPQGVYNIQAVQMAERTRLLVTGIPVGTDTTIVPVDTLKPPGAIKVVLPDTLDTINGYFYIAGTTIAVALKDNHGFLVLDSVPAGRTPSLYYGIKGAPSAPRKVRDSVMVESAATTSIVYSAWIYSRRLLLNTAATGANVSGAVTDFPVLIRLNRSNFNFAEAKSGGEDLRFAGSGGASLPFEIERWDTAAAAAEIWVKVDTVFGNNDTQWIAMYWGNASASPAGSGRAVFDTGAGFQGVWHLGQPGNTTAPDATPNGYHGTPYNMTAASGGMGIIGAAQKFSGDSDYIEMKNTAGGKLNFPENGRFTISAWINADTIDAFQRVIASKGPRQYYIKLKNTLFEFGIWKNNKGSHLSRTDAKAWDWCHIVGVRSDTRQYFYLNGTLADSAIAEEPSSLPVDQSGNFAIGADPRFQALGGIPGYASFNGKIDEIRVSGAARSPDWIKLCYMNQKLNNALVVFQK